MSFESIFQRVLVINLANKADRWEQFQAGVPADWPFAKPERFIATDGRRVPPPQWWQPNAAAWGCFR